MNKNETKHETETEPLVMGGCGHTAEEICNDSTVCGICAIAITLTIVVAMFYYFFEQLI